MTDLVEWLAPRVTITESGCWEWNAKRSSKGYGLIRRNRKWTRVTRLVTEAAAGLCALHRCDNPPCVRPDHLYVGTQSDNMRDAVSRGRWRRPPAPDKPAARVAVADVVAMRQRWRDGETYEQISRDYPIGAAGVAAIVRGKSWKEVPGAVPEEEAAVIRASRPGRFKRK